MNDSRGRLFSIAAGQNLPAIRVCSVGSLSDCQLHPFEPARFHFKFHPIPVGCAFLHASSLVSTARIRTLSPAAAAIITSMNSKLRKICQVNETKKQDSCHIAEQNKSTVQCLGEIVQSNIFITKPMYIRPLCLHSIEHVHMYALCISASLCS